MTRIKEWWLRRSKKWKLVIIIVPVAVAMIGVGGVYGSLAYFEANPSACGVCHFIQPYVDSYYESDFLDNAHAKAEDQVKCKDCHVTTLTQIALEGINFVLGNYELPLETRKYSQEFCFACHGNYEEIIELTKDLVEPVLIFDVNEGKLKTVEFNRHASHYGEVECSVCHKIHREQEDYCARCHSALDLGPGWIVPE